MNEKFQMLRLLFYPVWFFYLREIKFRCDERF